MIGPLESKKKKYFIFMEFDHYTKWIETKILTDKRAPSIMEAIQSVIFSKHGNPETISSDCGKEFTAKEVWVFLCDSEVEHVTGSPFYHPTTGAVEKVNRTFMNNYGNWAFFK